MKVLFKKELWNRPHLLVIIGLFVSCLAFIFLKTQDLLPTVEDINHKERIQVDGALLSYEIVDATDGDFLYQNLLAQKRELAKQLNSLSFEEPKKYDQNMTSLLQLRMAAANLAGYKDIQRFQPPISQTSSQLMLLESRNQEPHTMPGWQISGSDILLSYLSILGLIWVLICAFMTSNVLEDELEHPSVVQGQPLALFQRLLINASGKSIVLFGGLILSLLLGSLVLLLLGYSFFDLSNMSVIFLNGPMLIPKWQKIIIYLLIFVGWFIVMYLLSFVLNILVKNIFLTLLIETFTYGALLVVMEISSLPNWFIGYYISPTLFLSGRYWDVGGSNPTIWLAIMIVLGCAVLLAFGGTYLYRKHHELEVSR